MIEVNRVVKHFGKVCAVNGVSFTAKSGEIFGLLGPNGAGKTTTLRMLYGLLKPDEGDIFYDGTPLLSSLERVQQRIGALPDAGALYTRLTARENILYFARLHGLNKKNANAKLPELIEKLGMQTIIDRPTQGFSQGERMKVGLARILIHDPDFIFLDEPTNGLDVLTTRAVRALLLDLKSQGKTIIFSSHLMHEVNTLCDQVAIIAASQIQISGTPKAIILQAQAASLEDAFVHFAYPSETPEKAANAI